MNKLLACLLAVALIGTLSAPIAQNTALPSGRIGFVESQRVLKAHPRGAEVTRLQQDAQAELQPLIEQVNALRAKVAAGTASAAERSQLDVLTRTVQATQQRWQTRINTALEPITKDIDTAISATAKAEGYSIVMDRAVAGQSALVVYADEDTDMTDRVISRIAR
jgi:outer membrane protein